MTLRIRRHVTIVLKKILCCVVDSKDEIVGSGYRYRYGKRPVQIPAANILMLISKNKNMPAKKYKQY